jgi:hypothetical protein
MAKTTFASGTVVTSAYLNTIYGANAAGGHRHDGADANGSVDKVNLSDGTDVKGYLPPSQIDFPFRGFIDGLGMTYVVATDAWSIQFYYGAACSDNEPTVDGKSRRRCIWAQVNMTKKVIADSGTAYETWAAGGSGAGGVPAGVTAIADGVWLHAFIIGKSTDQAAYDFGFDSSLSAANLRTMAAGAWDMYRRVGSVLIESLGGGKFGIKKFVQRGDRFLWEDNGVEDHNHAVTSSGHEDATLTVPLGVVVDALIRASIMTTTTYGYALYHPKATDDTVPTYSGAPMASLNCDADFPQSFAELRVETDAAQKIRVSYLTDAVTGCTVYAITYGWVDSRGRS